MACSSHWENDFISVHDPRPKKVMHKEPMLCADIAVIARKKRPCWKRAVISAEYVEKVVNAPKNPVITSKFHSGPSFGSVSNMPRAIPMQYPPNRLAANVPKGTGEKNVFSVRPRPHLRIAPKDAPALMTRRDLTIRNP